jgi:RNA polymerase-binding transcription factor DksA
MMLTNKQLRRIERRLLQERERTLVTLDESQATAAQGELERTSDMSEAPTHVAERASETENEELEATLAAREIVQIEEIEAALERLYKRPQAFGRCERTGKQIPFERLEIVPWARTC